MRLYAVVTLCLLALCVAATPTTRQRRIAQQTPSIDKRSSCLNKHVVRLEQADATNKDGVPAEETAPTVVEDPKEVTQVAPEGSQQIAQGTAEQTAANSGQQTSAQDNPPVDDSTNPGGATKPEGSQETVSGAGSSSVPAAPDSSSEETSDSDESDESVEKVTTPGTSSSAAGGSSDQGTPAGTAVAPPPSGSGQEPPPSGAGGTAGEARDEFDLDSALTKINLGEDFHDWREGLDTLTDMNRHLLNSQLFTDCAFVVGPDDAKEVVPAHLLFLLRASPVLEAALTSNGRTVVNRPVNIRLKNISVNATRHVLDYIYTDEVCIEDLDVGCETLDLALRLGLPILARHARAFLYARIFPENVWRIYHCAERVNATRIKQMVMQMVRYQTQNVIDDHEFESLPREALEMLMEQDSLNVDSELRLFEAAVRWATAELARNNTSPEPQAIREVMGPLLGLVRFLLFTPAEFIAIQQRMPLLTPDESLAIIFNLNSPGIFPMPEGFSTSTSKRVAPQDTEQGTFQVIATEPSMCSSHEPASLAAMPTTFDAFTLATIPNKYDLSFRIIGVQLPLRKRSSNSSGDVCSKERESLSVFVIDGDDRILNETRFEGEVTSCDSPPKGWQPSSIQFPRPDWRLLNVRFAGPVVLPNYYGTEKHNKLKVVFHKNAEYPHSVGTGTFRASNRRGYHGAMQFDTTIGHFWLLGAKQFIYSFVTDN